MYTFSEYFKDKIEKLARLLKAAHSYEKKKKKIAEELSFY